MKLIFKPRGLEYFGKVNIFKSKKIINMFKAIKFKNRLIFKFKTYLKYYILLFKYKYGYYAYDYYKQGYDTYFC